MANSGPFLGAVALFSSSVVENSAGNGEDKEEVQFGRDRHSEDALGLGFKRCVDGEGSGRLNLLRRSTSSSLRARAGW